MAPLFQTALRARKTACVFLLGGAILCTVAGPAPAVMTAPQGLSLRSLEEFRATGVPDDQWPALLEAFGRPDQSAAVRSLVKDMQPFPAAKLVELLTNPKLAIRSGALDLLEEAAGDSFNFDPFLDDPKAGANLEALERWKAWSTGKPEAVNKQPLTDEQFRTLALEIMSGNRDRSERAMQRLDRFGLSAIGQIEAFFANQPALEPAAKAALKAAEYRLVLLQSLPKQGSALARDLCLGSVEARCVALATLGKAGVGVLPVIAEFITAPDPLVRETAVDAAFQAGNKKAAGLVAAQLSAEKSESVLHAMLRGLGENSTDESHITSVASFLKHPSENVVVSAIEALGKSSTGDVTSSLSEALNDSRWRVRSAALEAIGKRNLNEALPKVVAALKDPDLFVRVSAVETIARIDSNRNSHSEEPVPNATLLKEFAAQNDLKATILRTFLSRGNTAPLDLFQQLLTAPPDIIIQCLQTLDDRDDHAGKRAVYASFFVNHPNPDVAISSLRILAGHGKYTGLLLAALQSNDPVKQDAVLDVLDLPSNSISLGTEPVPTQESPAPKGNAILDNLYRTLGGRKDSAPQSSSNPSQAKSGPLQLPVDSPAPPQQMRAALEGFLKKGSPHQRFRAAVALASQGDEKGAQYLLDTYDTLGDAERRVLPHALYSRELSLTGPALNLARRLLAEPINDIRETAVRLWSKPDRVAGLLAELAKPGSLLQPDDIYDDWLNDLAHKPAARAPIRDWATKVLADTQARDPNKVLAIVLLSASGQTDPVKPFTKSSNPWLRRAAFRALGAPTIEENLNDLLMDDSAWVRAVIPFIAAPHNYGWRHWFDDAHSVADAEDFERDTSFQGREWGTWAQQPNSKAKTSPALVSALEKLSRDPSDVIRFEAQFALLRLNNPIDPAGFAALLAAQTDDSRARARIGSFLEKNYKTLDRRYAPLVALSERIYESQLAKILQHFGMDSKQAFTSFDALAKLSSPAESNEGNAGNQAPPSSTASTNTGNPKTQPPQPAPFRVLFFHKVGCRDCQRVREMLDTHAKDFPDMIVEEHDIADPKDALLNQALSRRFNLKENLHMATPAIFTQVGPLIRTDIEFARLGDLLRRNRSETPEPNWARVETQEIATAKEVVVQRYQSLSFGVIGLAGLLDGINPCAFATLIFLLSYLQVTRRTPREILAIGSAFILAVFLTYFAVGFGLAQALAKISGFQTAGKILNQVLAAFALVVAVLSFRDARLAAQGRLADMSIQLPSVLKTQIHSVIRQGSRATRFVLAAFLVGIAISLLELACTGQVYLPTILYMLHSGEKGAVGHLLLYNAAFIVPLVLVFGLAWGGMRTNALLRFQSEHTGIVKLLTGILFLALSAFLIFH